MDLYAQNGFVIPRLRTARFTLRPLQAGDGAAVVVALNQFDVTRWLTQVPFPYAPSDFDWFLNQFIPETRHMAWAIDDGTGLIGVVSVVPELGYWLDPRHHGKGAMTEAATAACHWYFAQSDGDLTSGYHIGNGPSQAVLRKLGFADTHINRAVETSRGDFVDIQRMALTHAGWQARHG